MPPQDTIVPTPPAGPATGRPHGPVKAASGGSGGELLPAGGVGLDSQLEAEIERIVLRCLQLKTRSSTESVCEELANATTQDIVDSAIDSHLSPRNMCSPYGGSGSAEEVGCDAATPLPTDGSKAPPTVPAEQQPQDRLRFLEEAVKSMQQVLGPLERLGPTKEKGHTAVPERQRTFTFDDVPMQSLVSVPGDVKSLQQKVDELSSTISRMQGKMDTLSTCATTMPSSAASTLRPGAGGGSQAGRPSTAQDKAAWSSSTYSAVAAVPDYDDTPPILSYLDLEGSLVEKVVKNEPDRHALGLSDLVVRDMANTVVREIVGIFESLLDRLLLEKKQDTIRTMVAELMTEDLKLTIATGHEQLKKEELGHIIGDLKRLRAELQERDVIWEDRFKVTKELRDSQADLWTTLDDRCKGIEKRVGDVESDFAKRAELREHVESLLGGLEDLRKRATKVEALAEERVEDLAELRTYCKEAYATKLELGDQGQRLLDKIMDACSESAAGRQELRLYAAPLTDLVEFKKQTEEVTKVLTTDVFALKNETAAADVQMKKFQRYCDETFVSKGEQTTFKEEVGKDLVGMRTTLATEVANLTDRTATKLMLEEATGATKKTVDEIQATLGTAVANLDKITLDVRAREETTGSYATKQYAYDTAQKLAQQVALEMSERERVALLRREFEEERERLRQTVRQQQHTRKDLTTQVEEVEALRARSVEQNKLLEVLRNDFDRLDGRELGHSQTCLAGLDSQVKANAELRTLHDRLRGDLQNFVEVQKGESEKLKNLSSQRYLEHMDKALGIHGKLQKIELDHGALQETVKNIKLPKV
eukprot:TRINITY_DN112733_c0_g1_i1.p1 TRINITY_DN112733_c0_g1~~TRINITY_DN112733_c0_g1_i1.p1  ORF type:complete len:821 (-),score=262.55 TRINITY_DN112733_c0_g1_i1:114-2576(-)